jgi:hypothetical protein
MSKPLGIVLSADIGGIGLSVRKPSPVEDAIWDAVEKAIDDGWTPKQFRQEVLASWEEKIDQNAKFAILAAKEELK